MIYTTDDVGAALVSMLTSHQSTSTYQTFLQDHLVQGVVTQRKAAQFCPDTLHMQDHALVMAGTYHKVL